MSSVTLGASVRALQTAVPIGTIVAFCSASAPTGWLLCNGGSYNVATYPALAAALGQASGGTFTLPNLTDGFLRGSSTFNSTRAGTDSVTLTQNELPSHTHSASASIASVGDHTHTFVQSSVQYYNEGNYNGAQSKQTQACVFDKQSTVNTGSGGSHTHSATVSITSTGTGAAFNILPGYYSVVYIIKALL